MQPEEKIYINAAREFREMEEAARQHGITLEDLIARLLTGRNPIGKGSEEKQENGRNTDANEQ